MKKSKNTELINLLHPDMACINMTEHKYSAQLNGAPDPMCDRCYEFAAAHTVIRMQKRTPLGVTDEYFWFKVPDLEKEPWIY